MQLKNENEQKIILIIKNTFGLIVLKKENFNRILTLLQHKYPKSKGLIISFEMFNFICVSLDNLLILNTKLIISLKNSIKIYPFIAYIGKIK